MARYRSLESRLTEGRGGVSHGAATPTAPHVGQRWYNPATAVTYQYTSDGATSFWLDISSQGIGTTARRSADYAGDTDPLPDHNGGSATLSVGQIYYNREGNRFFVCTDATTDANVWDGRYAGFGGSQTTVTVGGNTYRVHTFLGNDTFYMDEQKSCDILLVAGGGSGGNRHAGGGGAGGVLYKTGGTVAVGAYPIVIGVGGYGTLMNQGGGNNGTNSTAFGATAAGGGRGGGYISLTTGGAGGSGGGGSGSDNAAGGASSGNNLGSAQMNGGTAYGNVGQYGWYPGGGSAAGEGHHGGGGGGAGAHGGNYGSSPAWMDESLRSTDATKIAGGAGQQINIDGNNYYWGGGGGGSVYNGGSYAGNGGLGGGGGGGTHITPFRPGDGGGSAINRGKEGEFQNASDSGGDAGRNTGGGGGGCSQITEGSRGGHGGSGICIVRYQIA